MTELNSDLAVDLVGKYPDDDSEDLTDEEIAAALPTSGESGIVRAIQALNCDLCGEPFSGNAHELRRRKPHLYWRVRLVCAKGHMVKRVFLADWLLR